MPFRSITKCFLTAGFLFLNLLVFSQGFEGWVSYKIELLNPLPELFSESDWEKQVKENLGERGYMIKKYYIKNGKYLEDVDAGLETGFQLFNPKDNSLNAWQTGGDELYTSSASESAEEFIRIEESEDKDTILGIPCKSIVLYFTLGEMQIWYNSEHFKIDPAPFKEHKFEHWDQIFNKIGCRPLKIHRRFPNPVYIQTMMEYKAEQIPDEKFILPEFEESSDDSDY